MSEPFRGVVNLDIRDSTPDWAPFSQPVAPPGTPNVVYVVLDDVGFGALGCYGGLIETPNIDRIAAAGLRYTQWHTTALCSPTRSCLLTGRNHTINGMAWPSRVNRRPVPVKASLASGTSRRKRSVRRKRGSAVAT